VAIESQLLDGFGGGKLNCGSSGGRVHLGVKRLILLPSSSPLMRILRPFDRAAPLAIPG
jgi:hypothetical protein